MENYDAIIIGAGHNGLTCAAYLVKAGYSVLLLEKRSVPGGAATTEAILPEKAPGFNFNRCAIDHEFIHLGPVVEELELGKYGLEYLFCDPVVFCPHPDGTYFLGRKSIEATGEEIARFNRRDGEKYVEFMHFWQRLINAIVPVFNAPPKSIVDIAGNYDLKKIQDLLSLLGGPNKTLDLVRTLLSSTEDILNEWFDSEFVKAPLARLASELGAPPSQKNLAIGAMMMAMRHGPGMARPKGGTGSLVEALIKLVREHGGHILTDRGVKNILIENGRAIGVRTDNGEEYRAKYGVISNIDARRVFLQLIEPSETDAADPELRERLERRIVNTNDSILKIDLALSEPLRFDRYQHRDEYTIGSVIIADSIKQVEIGHTDPQVGKIPLEDPTLYVVQPTSLDPSMAPEGKHTLWIEFFAPYEVENAAGTGLHGTGWTEELKEKVADRIIDKIAEYAPNLKNAIIDRYIESPADLSERLGSYKGNHYHIDMSLEQMIFFRPLPELANYKTPIEGLYLTGAGTHPGGSISGMPGRNCARTFLHDRQPIYQPLVSTLQNLQSGAKNLISR